MPIGRRIGVAAGVAALIICVSLLFGSASASIEENGQRGREALVEGNYTSAINLLTMVIECVNLAPLIRAQAHVDRSSAYVALNRASPAIEDLDAAAVLYQQLGDQDRLTNVRLLLAEQRLMVGDFDGAIELFGTILGVQQQNIPARMGLGRVYLATGEYNRAITEFDRAQVLDELNSEVYLYKGQAFAELGNNRTEQGREIGAIEAYQGAMRELDQATALNPDDARINIARAGVLANLGRTDIALEELEFALDIGSADDRYQAFLARSELYNLLGEFDEMVKNVSAAIAIRPNDPTTYFTRGDAYIEHGDTEIGLADLSVAIDLSRGAELVAAYLHRGVTYLDQDDPAAAMADFAAAQGLDDENAEILFHIGQAHLATKNPAALELFDQALAIDPNNVTILRTRGVTRTRLGIRIAIVCDLLREDGQLADEQYSGCRARAQSEYDLAIEDLTAALRELLAIEDLRGALGQLEANNLEIAAIFTDRGIVNHLSGLFDEAANDFSQSLNTSEAIRSPFAALWQYLSAGRANENAARLVLAQFHERLEEDEDQGEENLRNEEDEFYDLVIRLMIGDIRTTRYGPSLKDLANGDATVQAKGAYYLGQFQLLRGRERQAKTQFEKATDNEDLELYEYQQAAMELGRLREAK